MERLNPKDFDKVYRLMQDSFPTDEIRSYKGQYALLENPVYRLYVSYGDSGELSAFVAVWQLESLAFIEHIAVNSKLRSSGMGARILQEVAGFVKGTLCLEVEPPLAEMPIRRINFYKRNGFHLNEYPYIMPALEKDRSSVEMMIMTYGSGVSREDFEIIKNELYTHVYGL